MRSTSTMRVPSRHILGGNGADTFTIYDTPAAGLTLERPGRQRHLRLRRRRRRRHDDQGARRPTPATRGTRRPDHRRRLGDAISGDTIDVTGSLTAPQGSPQPLQSDTGGSLRPGHVLVPGSRRRRRGLDRRHRGEVSARSRRAPERRGSVDLTWTAVAGASEVPRLPRHRRRRRGLLLRLVERSTTAPTRPRLAGGRAHAGRRDHRHREPDGRLRRTRLEREHPLAPRQRQRRRRPRSPSRARARPSR